MKIQFYLKTLKRIWKISREIKEIEVLSCLYLLCLSLLKKSIIETNLFVLNLSTKNNIYSLPYFNEFVKTKLY